jgi:hypothetical protein
MFRSQANGSLISVCIRHQKPNGSRKPRIFNFEALRYLGSFLAGFGVADYCACRRLAHSVLGEFLPGLKEQATRVE